MAREWARDRERTAFVWQYLCAPRDAQTLRGHPGEVVTLSENIQEFSVCTPRDMISSRPRHGRNLAGCAPWLRRRLPPQGPASEP
eukprot:8727287-Alexandrium_andersonii.AAC.1